MSEFATYEEHIGNVIKKAKQKSAWINRSFVRNDINFRRKLWKTYIEGAMDYGSQVWSPVCKTKLARMETVLKGFLSNSKNMGKNTYWQNLKIAKMSSIQQRHERYKIFYIWKIINGICPNYGLKWSHNTRRGILIDIPILNSYVPDSIKTIRDQSLTVHGGRMFNLLPAELRNFAGKQEMFKKLLDEFLGRFSVRQSKSVIYEFTQRPAKS